MVFSTVKAVIEAVGRTRASNWGELDKLTCLWTGPTGQVDSVGMGAPHPQYGNLEVNAIRKIADVAGVTKLELDYVGLFSGLTRGPILREKNSTESEIEYQEPHGPTETGFNVTSSTDPQGNVTQTITVTWRLWALSTIIRYLSNNMTLMYVARQPDGPIGGANTSVDLISTRPGGTAQSTFISQTFTVLPGSFDSISGGPDQALYLGTGPWGFHTETYCSSYEAQPISPNWYKCRETWTTRYFAG